MSSPSAPATGDADVARLQDLLSRLPSALDPPDISALDGFLCGVLVQPAAVAADDWQPFVLDLGGRPIPAGFGAAELLGIVRRRHQELDQAIATRSWFDPWILEPEAPTAVGDALRPWVAGFALALERFGGLLGLDRPSLREPLALLYRHLPAEDLEVDPELADLLAALEPVTTLDEAVEDLVCAVLLLADIGRPVSAAGPGRRSWPTRRGGARGRRG